MTNHLQKQEEILLKNIENHIGTLTLNRPKAFNALSVALMTELISQLEEINNNPDIHIVIIKGAGRGFCAGHDLKEIKNNPEEGYRKVIFDTCSKLMLTITNLRQPVIAQVHGIATAAGCQLVAACDLAIASDDSKFATPGVNIGLFCSTPMVALSRTVPKKHAMEMLLTGDMINAEKAVEFGLINHAVPADSLEVNVNQLAEKIAAKSGLVLKTGKEAFYKQIEYGLEDAYQYCSQVMVENMNFLDADEGISAFIEKRIPEWKNQ